MIIFNSHKRDLKYNNLPDIPPNPNGGSLYKEQEIKQDPIEF
jgi:hypothetical protein